MHPDIGIVTVDEMGNVTPDSAVNPYEDPEDPLEVGELNTQGDNDEWPEVAGEIAGMDDPSDAPWRRYIPLIILYILPDYIIYMYIQCIYTPIIQCICVYIPPYYCIYTVYTYPSYYSICTYHIIPYIYVYIPPLYIPHYTVYIHIYTV